MLYCFKPGAGSQYACVSVCVCVCVPAPRLLSLNNQTSPRFLYMTLDVDITDGCGLSNEACHELQPKNSKVMLFIWLYALYCAVHFTV